MMRNVSPLEPVEVVPLRDPEWVGFKPRLDPNRESGHQFPKTEAAFEDLTSEYQKLYVEKTRAASKVRFSSIALPAQEQDKDNSGNGNTDLSLTSKDILGQKDAEIAHLQCQLRKAMHDKSNLERKLAYAMAFGREMKYAFESMAEIASQSFKKRESEIQSQWSWLKFRTEKSDRPTQRLNWIRDIWLAGTTTHKDIKSAESALAKGNCQAALATLSKLENNAFAKSQDIAHAKIFSAAILRSAAVDSALGKLKETISYILEKNLISLRPLAEYHRGLCYADKGAWASASFCFCLAYGAKGHKDQLKANLERAETMRREALAKDNLASLLDPELTKSNII